jgi:Ribosomal protein S8
VDTKSKKNTTTFNSRYFRGVPYFAHFKIISTPSKTQSISAGGLRVISKSIGNSVLLIETDKGIINHIEAIKYNIGGKLLAIIS